MKSAFDYINEMNKLWFQYTPNEWEIKNLGHVSKMIVPMRDKPTSFDGTIPWVRIEDFDGKYISDSKSNQYVSEEFIKSMNLKVFPKGTVMCTCSCSMGATAIVKQPLVSNQTFIGIVPSEELNSEYLYYLMQASADRLQMFSQGAIQQYLSRHNFEHLKIPFPSTKNQKRIVDFLNNKLENLDEIIRNKNNLLKLLEQQRQSIITEAVTKGLNSNVKMKESGVEWIGEIPEHWEVRKIKDVGNVYSSNVDKKSVEGEKEVLLCNYVDVYYNDSITVNLDFMKATAKVDQIKIFTLKKHDVIITKDSESPTDIAIPTWVSQDLDGVVCGYHLSLIRCAESVLGHYLYYALESVQIREQFYTRANGVTRYGLSKEAIKNGLIAVPPYNEQLQIAEKLYADNKEIRDMTEKVKAQIEKLKEYRQALIYEAVTGKIDVRDMELD